MQPLSPFRRFAIESVMWLFGMSLTVLLVGTWGRVVTHHQPTVESAAVEVADAAAVSDRVVEWITGAVEEELDAMPPDVVPVVEAAIASPPVRATLSRVVEQMVAAAFAPEGSQVTVDVRSEIEAVLPEIVGHAEAQGVAVDTSEVATVVASLDPIVLPTGQEGPVGGGLEATRTVLRTAMLVSGIAAILFGLLVLVISPDRRLTVKRLGIRAALTGLGFTVMAYLGAWALDPSRGGSDVTPSLRSAAAILLRSNLHVPLLLAAGGGVVWYLFRASKPRFVEARPEPSPAPVEAAVKDDARPLTSVR